MTGVWGDAPADGGYSCGAGAAWDARAGRGAAEYPGLPLPPLQREQVERRPSRVISVQPTCSVRTARMAAHARRSGRTVSRGLCRADRLGRARWASRGRDGAAVLGWYGG